MAIPLPAWVRSLAGDLGRGLLHLVYPALCHLCGQSLAPGNSSLCDSCRRRLLGDSLSTCPRCAGTVGPFANTDGGCAHCRDRTFAFESTLRLGPYHDHWRDAVLRLKHHAGEGLAWLLGALWATHARARFDALHLDVIVPVPLHWRRRWQRGYNQSAELAHGMGSVLGLPCRPGCLRRIRSTPIQSVRNLDERRANVRGAFRAVAPRQIRGASVLLVDDVMSSGSTAHEASTVLRKAGASRVVVAVLCRATL